MADKDPKDAEIAALTKQLAAEIAGRKKDQGDAQGLIEDLTTQLAAGATPAAIKTLVKLRKTTYEVTAPKFHFDGKVHEAADLKDNSDVLKALVKAGAGVLVEVTEAAATETK